MLPLITFPYQVRVLGIESFGLLSFSLIFISYFSIIADFGFNIVGVREVSQCINNNKKLNEVFSSIQTIKAIILITSFIIYLFIILFFEKFNENISLFLLSYTIVISQALYPIWYFQGIEKMKIITILNAISKFVFTILIFLYVKSEKDILLIPLFSFLGFFLITLYSNYSIIAHHKIKYFIPNVSVLLYYLKNSWYIFISNISVTLYTTTNAFMLGVLTNNSVVGNYMVANKIITAIRGMFDPVSQTFFPYLSKLDTLDQNKAIVLKKKILKYGLIAVIPISAFLMIFADSILYYVFDVNDLNAILNLRIQSVIPILILFHIVIGLFVIIIKNNNKEYSRIITFAGLIGMPLTVLTIYFFDDIGASLSLVLIESVILVSYIRFTKKKYNKVIS